MTSDPNPPPTEAEAAALFASTKDFSLGCMLASLIIDTFLCGVLLMQVINYWTYQRHDSWYTRGVVIYAVTLCFGITGFIWFFISHLFVENFGLYAPILETRYLSLFPVFDSLTSAGIQGFFAHRAFLLTKRSWPLLVLIIALILCSFSAAIVAHVRFSSLNSEIEANQVQTEIYIWLSSIMAADIIITIAILSGLIRSKTGWAHTDKTITKLIRMTFESQLPPTVLAIAFVAEFARQPNSLLGATLQAVQSKIYGIGLMFALNSRVTFNQDNTKIMGSKGGQVFGMSTRGPATQINVEIETETYVHDESTYPRGFNNRAKLDDDESLPDDKADAFTSQARLTQVPNIV